MTRGRSKQRREVNEPGDNMDREVLQELLSTGRVVTVLVLACQRASYLQNRVTTWPQEPAGDVTAPRPLQEQRELRDKGLVSNIHHLSDRSVWRLESNGPETKTSPKQDEVQPHITSRMWCGYQARLHWCCCFSSSSAGDTRSLWPPDVLRIWTRVTASSTSTCMFIYAGGGQRNLVSEARTPPVILIYLITTCSLPPSLLLPCSDIMPEAECVFLQPVSAQTSFSRSR